MEDHVWALVQETNRKWLAGEAEQIADRFHPEVVMASPDGQVLSRGREAMVDGFVQYCAAVKTLHFEEGEPSIEVFEGTAVVNYPFDVTYVLNGDTFTERGRELLVFQREADRWLIVWRAQLPVTG